MSAAAVLVLPWVWATARPAIFTPIETTQADIAFYRKYTEGLLLRYWRLATESGKIPCLLGQDMFRAKVTSYRMSGFDDAVIFVHDVENCLSKLDPVQKEVIVRVGVHRYALVEAAQSMGIAPRTVLRHYSRALDRLTRIFLQVKLLEPLKVCQGG